MPRRPRRDAAATQLPQRLTMTGEPAPNDAAAAAASPSAGDPRTRTMRILTARYLCRAASELLVRNVNDTCWMLAFDDAATQAIVRGQIISAMEVLTFLVTPVVTAASDAFGRKPVQVCCALLNLGYQLCVSAQAISQ